MSTGITAEQDGKATDTRLAEWWWSRVYGPAGIGWSPVERRHLYALAAAGGWTLRAP